MEKVSGYLKRSGVIRKHPLRGGARRGLNVGARDCLGHCKCPCCQGVSLRNAEDGRVDRVLSVPLRYGFSDPVCVVRDGAIQSFVCPECRHVLAEGEVIVVKCRIHFKGEWANGDAIDEQFVAADAESYRLSFVLLQSLNLHKLVVTAHELRAVDSMREADVVAMAAKEQSRYASELDATEDMVATSSSQIAWAESKHAESWDSARAVEEGIQGLNEQLEAACAVLGTDTSSTREAASAGRERLEALRAVHASTVVPRQDYDQAVAALDNAEARLANLNEDILATMTRWRQTFLRRIGALAGGPRGLYDELGKRLGVESRVPPELRDAYDANLSRLQDQLATVNTDRHTLNDLNLDMAKLLVQMQNNDLSIRDQLRLILKLEDACKNLDAAIDEDRKDDDDHFFDDHEL